MIEAIQLRRAREYLGLTAIEVAAQIGVEQERLMEWEEGTSEPDADQLTRLAEAYHRGLDYFLRPTPAPPGAIHLRLARPTALADVAAEDREVLARFDELCRAEWELEQLLGEVMKADVPRAAARLGAEELAVGERQRLGLPEGPIKDLRGALERTGVRAFEIKVPKDSFAGVAWWHVPYGPCILVNAGDTKGRRNFTFVHEYAHLLFRDRAGLCDLEDRREERPANAFAAAFLMPADAIRDDAAARHLPGRPRLRGLRTMADKWGVSAQALAIRLAQLGLVDRETPRQVSAEAEAEQQYLRSPRQPAWQRRLGERFLWLAIEAHRRGHISLGVLAHYLDQPLVRARDLVRERTGE